MTLPTTRLPALLLFFPALLVGAGQLEIFWIDTEGGAATLVVTPAGESVLIDSGNPGGRDSSRIHKVATESAGLERIDYLITTHFHLDHFGGAAELSRLMPIGTVLDNGIPDSNPDNRPGDTRFPLLIRPYREMNVERRRILDPGEKIPLRQEPGTVPLELLCLAARRRVMEVPDSTPPSPQCDSLPPSMPRDTSDNADSIVLLLEYGDFRFFDAGDLTWNVESLLICPRNVVGSTVDVYQVTHHGLDSSNHPSLVRALAPVVTVMNNGVTKGCNPRTRDTLAALPSARAHYQMHKNLREDIHHNTSDELIANPERACRGNHIRLTVAPDGSRYTVSIPARDHRRTFATTAKPVEEAVSNSNRGTRRSLPASASR